MIAAKDLLRKRTDSVVMNQSGFTSPSASAVNEA